MGDLDVRYIHSLYELRLYKPNGDYWPISLLKWVQPDRDALEKFLELSSAASLTLAEQEFRCASCKCKGILQFRRTDKCVLCRIAELEKLLASHIQPQAPRGTVGLDQGGTRRCCNNLDCSNDYPCADHPEASHPQDERGAFEKWWNFERDGTVTGNLTRTKIACFSAWQAAMASRIRK